MNSFRLLIVSALLLGLVIAGASQAEAHNIEPLKSFNTRIGPYPVTVNYYSEPRGGQALSFSIVPETGESFPTSYEVTAIPGTLVEAVPVKALLAPDYDHPNSIQGTVNLPVSGQWLLYVEVEGPLGPSFEDVPILAGAPPVIPEWLGWMIGLIPAWGLIGFILWQARRPQLQPLASGTD